MVLHLEDIDDLWDTMFDYDWADDYFYNLDDEKSEGCWAEMSYNRYSNVNRWY